VLIAAHSMLRPPADIVQQASFGVDGGELHNSNLVPKFIVENSEYFAGQ